MASTSWDLRCDHTCLWSTRLPLIVTQREGAFSGRHQQRELASGLLREEEVLLLGEALRWSFHSGTEHTNGGTSSAGTMFRGQGVVLVFVSSSSWDQSRINTWSHPKTPRDLNAR